MTLIEILFDYAWTVYHYGRKAGDEDLTDMGVDVKIKRSIQLSVDDNGNFLKSDDEDGDFIYYPHSVKDDIYRPNDSKRPTLAAQTDPRIN